MERRYLFVPPEEYAELRAAGAAWDEGSKRWYVPSSASAGAFERWSGEAGGEESLYVVVSGTMKVAAGEMECRSCGGIMGAICLYGVDGLDLETEEPLADFTLSNVWAVDEGLAGQLAAWPLYKKSGDGVFGNHCPGCGAVMPDYLLHSEPGDLFFGLAMRESEAGMVVFTGIEGVVRVGGDLGFKG